MINNDYWRVFVLRIIGNFLLLTAVTTVVFTFGPVVRAEVGYRVARWRGVKYVVGEDSIGKTDKTNKIDRTDRIGQADGFGKLTGEKVEIITPVDTEFGIVIPKIKANSRVVGDVDAGNEDEYLQALKTGVAHAKGTVKPGTNGNSYIFAHSTDNWFNVVRYNAVFYLLKELSINDEIDIFYNNRRYIYRVFDIKIVEAEEVEWIFKNYDEPVLTLQTCWPPGTTLKRLLVLARMR